MSLSVVAEPWTRMSLKQVPESRSLWATTEEMIEWFVQHQAVETEEENVDETEEDRDRDRTSGRERTI